MSGGRQSAENVQGRCPEGCLGHGGKGVCPHCGDWHADDFSCCAGPAFDLVVPPASSCCDLHCPTCGHPTPGGTECPTPEHLSEITTSPGEPS